MKKVSSPIVEEWFRLYERVRDGKYKLPIRCIIVNATNKGILITDIRWKNDTRGDFVELRCDDGKIITVDAEHSVLFKYGKDSSGATVFISSL